MSHSAAGLAVPVEHVMTRRIVQILEERNDLMVAIAPEAV